MRQDSSSKKGQGKTKPVRLPSYAKLRKKLDRVFGAWIRRRDTLANGLGYCISCRQFAPLQCGHFIKRQHLALRWDERNAHGQCLRCNHFLGGNEAEYYHALLKRYGQFTMNELMRRKHDNVKYTRTDLQEMIAKFSLKD